MTIEMEGGGTLQLWEEGGRAVFFCRRGLRRDGLYKVWLRGDGGEVLLGTLVPEGEALVLRRSIWHGELRGLGCWPVRGARCAMAFPFQKEQWCWEERPRRLVDDETAALGQWCRMLYRTEGDGFLLAVPLREEEPIPLSHLFCMAAPRQIGGQMCLVWRFDTQGRPRWPEGMGDEGQSCQSEQEKNEQITLQGLAF